MIPLANITARVQKSFADLLKAVTDGQLSLYVEKQSIATAFKETGMALFRISLVQAKAWARGVAQPEGTGKAPELRSISQLSASGSVPRGRGFPRLVEDGHTPATQTQVISGGRFAAWLSQKDLEAFRARYITADEVSSIYGANRRDVCDWLKQYGIVPFAADNRDYGMIWLRADLEALNRPGVIPYRRNQVPFFISSEGSKEHVRPRQITALKPEQYADVDVDVARKLSPAPLSLL